MNTYNDDILDFIARRFPITEGDNNDWMGKNCYYFARILKSRFKGEIFYDLKTAQPIVYFCQILFYRFNVFILSFLQPPLDQFWNVKRRRQENDRDQCDPPIQHKKSCTHKDDLNEYFTKQGDHLEAAGFDRICFICVLCDVFTLRERFIFNIIPPENTFKDIPFQLLCAARDKPCAKLSVTKIKQSFAEDKYKQQNSIPESGQGLSDQGMIKYIAFIEL